MLQSIPAADFLPWKAAGDCDKKTSLQKSSTTCLQNQLTSAINFPIRIRDEAIPAISALTKKIEWRR